MIKKIIKGFTVDKMQIITNIIKAGVNKEQTVRELMIFVNGNVNRNFLYIKDVKDGTKNVDVFCKDGGGDCEDFAYIKGYIIKEILKSKKFKLSYSMFPCVTKTGILHCILEVVDGKDKYYLDNLISKIDLLEHTTVEVAYAPNGPAIHIALSKKYNNGLV